MVEWNITWDLVMRILVPVMILIGTAFLAHILNNLLRKSFERAQRAMIDRHYKTSREIKADKTRFAVIRRLFMVAIYVVGLGFVVVSIPGLKALSYSLFAGAGIFAIVIGFATQKAFSNIIAGIFIATSEPFHVGDRLEFEGELGDVEDITLRHTVIKTWDNKRLVVPNAQITETKITNYSLEDDTVIYTIDMTISYDSSIDLARNIMLGEVEKHPDSYAKHNTQGHVIDVERKGKVRVKKCGDNGVELTLYFWAPDQPTGFSMKCDLTESIKKAFDKEGIEIPYPYRTIVYKKDLKKPKAKKKTKK
jgi:small conductance mechanosensitive channel